MRETASKALAKSPIVRAVLRRWPQSGT